MTKDTIIAYFKGVKSEWGKITWPDRKQVIGHTIIVLAVVVVFTVYTYGLDLMFQMLLRAFNLKA